MLGKWERKSLRVGTIIGAMLLTMGVLIPEGKTSFYEKLFGIILLLGCLGVFGQVAILSSKKDEDSDDSYH